MLMILFSLSWLLAMLQVDIPQPTTQIGILILMVIAPITSWLGTKIYDGIKTAWPWWDRQSALIHQIAAPIVEWGLGWLSMALSLPILTDVHGITASWLAGGLLMLGAQGIKRWEKSKAPVDATQVLAQSRQP